jgi:hypothetical protein
LFWGGKVHFEPYLYAASAEAAGESKAGPCSTGDPPARKEAAEDIE